MDEFKPDPATEALASSMMSYYYPGERGRLNSLYENQRDEAVEILKRLRRRGWSVRPIQK